MQVCITGATGFLGEWVVKECHKRGYDIHIVCRASSDLSKIKDIPFTKHTANLAKAKELTEAFKDMDFIIHLAGLVAYKRQDYQQMWQTNVDGTANVLKAMKTNKIKDMIYLSSVVAIGSSKTAKILNEKSEFTISGLNLGYFDSKHAAEKLVLEAYNKGYVNPVIINPSTIYGPGDFTKGSRKSQLKVAQGKFPFYTSGGVNVVHINDVIKLMFLAFDKKIIGKRIIAAGENITIKQLFIWIAEAAGKKAPSIYLPNFALFAIAYISEILNWLGLKGPISIENAYTASMYHWFKNDYAKSLGMDFQASYKAIIDSVEWAKKNELL